MHPLTTDLGEQILALIKIQSYSLLGAIQDNKTVLGGSAGSDGGVGDPPAGFVGQLTQSNVAYDTTEAAYSGGSTSLVDNLAHIRQEGGGIKTIGQVVSVGVSGCNYTLVSDAVAYINGLGDAAADKPYLIWVMSGVCVDDAGDITIPSWVMLSGQGESTTLDLGDATLRMAADSSLENLVVTSTAENALWVVIEVIGNNVVMDDVRVICTNWNTCIEITGYSGVKLYRVTVETDTQGCVGFYTNNSTVEMWNCHADDATNFWPALLIGFSGTPSTVTTRYCTFHGASGDDDVDLMANCTWNHFCCNFDPDNCTLTGTEVPLTHGKTNFDDEVTFEDGIMLEEMAAAPGNVANAGWLYTLDDGGDTELFYEDDGGAEAQMTEDGAIHLAATNIIRVQVFS